MSTDRTKLTPMLRQYFDIKETVGDAILFFRMGDFFEIFGSDAEEVAPKIEVVLTSREKGDGAKIPFCGVPHHSAKGYWLRLIKLGYKVAICEQLEDAAEAKGLVKRGVTRVYTPGSIDELEGLEQENPNYLLAWTDVPGHGEEVMAAIDVSTGEFRLGSVGRGELLRYVRQFKPSELLVRRYALPQVQKVLEPWVREHQLRIDVLPEAPLKDEDLQRETLDKVFGASDLRSQGCGQVVGGEAIVTAIVSYIQSLGASIGQFMRIMPLNEPESVALSETVLRDLEVFETSRRRQTDGSLARVIDRTLSPMGSRALRYALAHPLVHKGAITKRHDAVEAFVKSGEESFNKLRGELKNTPDLARLTTRIVAGSVSPHELAMVRNSLAKANAISPLLLSFDETTDSLKSLAEGLVSAGTVLAILADVMVDSPEGLGTGRGVFRSGFDAFLDEKNQLAVSGEEKVAAYEEGLRQKTGITSLKVKSHKSFGLLLEVTKSNVGRVPDYFIRRQTMTNGERYTTVDLKELDEELASANDQAVQREVRLYQELLERLKVHRESLMQVAKALGELDMLQSFAWLALKEGYAKPIMTENPRRLTLKSCRHPVVEKFVGRHEFVPNDVLMNDGKRLLLITGPNMAGKSTIMRQTAIAAILCQAGSWVPASEAEMPVFDRIFTRVGASDDLSRGQSTFMVEMSEAAEILRQASARSLVILDEVGRGTSTTDGLAIAAAIMEDLSDRICCFTLFATHYHELVSMMETRKCVVPVQTEVIDKQGRIAFSHRLIAGASTSSFGIEVAKLAGVPSHVIDLANARLSQGDLPALRKETLRDHASSGASVKDTSPAKALSKVQKGLFGLGHDDESDALGVHSAGEQVFNRVLSRLETVKIHKTTPLQALNILNELKSMLVPVQQRTLFDDDVTIS